MENRIFNIALLSSFVIHTLVIVYYSHTNITVQKKSLKQMEVTYQAVEKDDLVSIEEAFNDFEISQSKEAKKREVDILSKNFDEFSRIDRKVRDISKFSKNLSLSQKETPRINTLDIDRKITIPHFSSEKISSPQYLSYNQNIEIKFKRVAFRYTEHPDYDDGTVHVSFVVSRAGYLQEIKINEAKTQASSYLRKITTRSLRESAPFQPFPVDLDFDELTFNVIINYKRPTTEVSRR